jgi:2,3-dihydroxybiphenyl 1,2-dioxygenase
MDILGIGYLGLETPNPGAWRAFGGDILGFAVAQNPEGDPDSVYLRMDDRRHRLAVHPGKVDRLAYIGWEAKDRIAYEEALEKFAAAGVETIPGDAELCALRGVRAVSRFVDPVGYQHEIFFGQKWSPGSFASPRPHGGFDCGDDGDQGLGHVVLIAPDYTPELERFLTKVMGFRWYGYGGGTSMGFFSTKLNKRSHCIAYGAAPGRMGLQHIGVYVRTLNDVGIAYDLVKSAQVPLQQTMGRHTQDPVVSFYCFTPLGCALEYIWEETRFGVLPFEANPEKISVWGHHRVGPILGDSVKTPEEIL